jgi:WD40 repeat protein
MMRPHFGEQGSSVPWRNYVKTAESLVGGGNDVVCMCGDRDGGIYCGFEDGNVRGYTIGAPKVVESWSGYGGHEVKALVCIGGNLVSGCGGASGNMRVWRAADGAFVADLPGHIDTVYRLTARGELLLSTSKDGTCRIWDICGDPADWVSKRTIAAIGIGGNADVYNGGVVIGLSSGVIHMWDISTGAQVKTLEGHTARVLALLVCGNQLFSSGKDKTIRVWNLDTYECTWTSNMHRNAYYMAMEGDNLIVSLFDGYKSGGVHVYDTDHMTRDRSAAEVELIRPPPILCAFQRLYIGDGRWLHSCKPYKPCVEASH